MKQLFQEILDRIPEYQSFLTFDEMEESTWRIAKAYPDLVEVFPIGQSRAGRPLNCIRIGSGRKNALLFGLPHPNEPIGTMLLEYLIEALVTNEALRAELDYSWYIVKAWDADGFALNEGWLKGPYTIFNYSRHFFRPAGHKQVDWTFPIDYKDLHFHEPLPETVAMMQLIDRIQPHFIYSLHNAGFGGAYWYISAAVPELYEEMREIVISTGVPLNLGEPEAPYCKLLSPAFYESLGIEQEYDYLEQYGEEKPASKISVGSCSASFAKARHGSFTLLTELPYFFDPRISDLSEGKILRREAALKSLEQAKQKDSYIQQGLALNKDYLSEDNPFRLALEAFSSGQGYEATIKMINENPDYARLATVAEEFDNIDVSRFYGSLSYGMMIRLNEFELERMVERGEHNEAKRSALTAAKTVAEQIHQDYCLELEQSMNYRVVPISDLVKIQLASGLLVADYLQNKEALNV